MGQNLLLEGSQESRRTQQPDILLFTVSCTAIGNLLYRTVNFQRYCTSFPYYSWESLIAVWVLSRVVLLLQLGKSSYPC